MIEFQRKLIVILLESELNKIKGKPIYFQPSGKEHVSNTDCMIVECQNTQNLSDQAQDQSSILAHHLLSMDQHELFHELRKHVMSITDANVLE
jgi:hypothetical protein